jgi:TonB family protein
MHNNSLRFFVFVCVMLGSAVCSVSKEDSVNQEALLTQARKLHEVWTAGTPPVMMRAEIQVFNGKGGVTPGQYIVSWVSPVRWREELRFPNYERVRVHDAKGYWQKSGLNFQPEIIFQLDALVDFKSVLKVRAKQVIDKVKSREKDGVRQRCVEVRWTKGTERILCFDEVSGNLLSVEYPRNENENPPEISRVEYGAFHDVGEKRLPLEIRTFRDKTVVATVRVVDMRPLVGENPSLFVAPTNSEFWAQCDDMQEPELVGQVQPQYPVTARRKYESGTVIFYAVIGTDGTLSHLTVIQQVTPAIEAAAADALRQWRYKPAACGSTAVRVETSIDVDFHIRY